MITVITRLIEMHFRCYNDDIDHQVANYVAPSRK